MRYSLLFLFLMMISVFSFSSNANAAACEKNGRPKNETGCCYTENNGRISWGPEHCGNPAVCDRNMVPKGNAQFTYWYNNTCNSISQSTAQAAQAGQCGPGASPIEPSDRKFHKSSEPCSCPETNSHLAAYAGFGVDCASVAKAKSVLQSDTESSCKAKGANWVFIPNANECLEKIKGDHEDEPIVGPAPATSCIADLKKKINQCKEKGISAVQKCQKDNTSTNEIWGNASQLLKLGEMVLKKKCMAGESPAECCLQTGFLATGAYSGMDLLKQGCDAEAKTCADECEEAKTAIANISSSCASETNGSEKAIATMKAEVETLKEELNKGLKACTVTAKSNAEILKNAMSGADNAAQQAAQCHCQLTAGQQMTAEGKCEDIQGPEYCAEHPGDVNCPAVVDSTIPYVPPGGELAPPGKITNPNGPSSVASAFSPIDVGGPSLKGGGGSIGKIDMGSELSGPISGDKSAGNADSPFGAAAGGGGGGGGGGFPSGSDGGPRAGGEPEEKSGIAGFFNSLKGGLANVLGGSGKPTDGKNYRDKVTGQGLNPEAWRPPGLRGIAGGQGIGSRNMDIFKMINGQYDNQYPSFFTTTDTQKPK